MKFLWLFASVPLWSCSCQRDAQNRGQDASGTAAPAPNGDSAGDSSVVNAGQMGGGMMGGSCPMCGRRNGQGTDQTIPQNLPAPQNAEWIEGLREILSLERLSRIQYEQDSRTYSAHMPYGMIVPQEVEHIASIEALFSAYGLNPGNQTLAIRKTATLEEAYAVCIELEAGLIPRYERVVNEAPDPTTRNVLESILVQTRMHYTMFQHALSMTGRHMGR